VVSLTFRAGKDPRAARIEPLLGWGGQKGISLPDRSFAVIERRVLWLEVHYRRDVVGTTLHRVTGFRLLGGVSIQNTSPTVGDPPDRSAIRHSPQTVPDPDSLGAQI
jgi:hypothetical protein